MESMREATNGWNSTTQIVPLLVILICQNQLGIYVYQDHVRT